MMNCKIFSVFYGTGNFQARPVCTIASPEEETQHAIGFLPVDLMQTPNLSFRVLIEDPHKSQTLQSGFVIRLCMPSHLVSSQKNLMKGSPRG